MNRHVDFCRTDDCPYCQDLAEDRKAARDEPLSVGEEQDRDNDYEARYGA